MLKESHRKSSEGGVANEQKTTGTQNTNNYHPPPPLQYNLANLQKEKIKAKEKQSISTYCLQSTHIFSLEMLVISSALTCETS